MNKKEGNKLEIWERQLLRKIYAEGEENGKFRERANKEIQELFIQPRIIQMLKCRSKWLGFISRTSKDR